MIYSPLSVLPDNDYFPYGETITTTWKNSGDMMHAFRHYVRNNSTDELVYDSGEITSYTPRSVISLPLPIGEYKHKLVVYNANASVENRGSAESDWKIFHIVASPTLTLNLTTDDTISTQTLSLSADYSHPEGVRYKNFRFLLYDEDKNTIEQSNYLTSSNLEYTYTTLLANNATYFAQVMVTTYDNIEAFSDMVRFKVVYIKPNLNFNLHVETYDNKPYVYLYWSVARIIGEILGDGFYVDINNVPVTEANWYEAQKLNVLNSGAQAVFAEGFTIDDDFTMHIWVEGITEDKEFFIIKDASASVNLILRNGKVHLYKNRKNTKISIHCASKEINYTGTEKLLITVQQIGKRIGVEAETIE